VFLSLAFAFGAGLAVPAQDGTSHAVEIKMTAKKYEFSPDTVRVKQGDHVKLVITALDREHGIKINAFQINQKLPKGEAVTVDFIADRAGTFPFQCSDFCGLGHGKMKGELIVE
jgi:cytochrome c oxidase subunit 2